MGGSVFTIQGQMVEIPLQSPGKLNIFQFCPYVSTYPSLKSGTPTPIKILFSKLTRIDLSSHKVYSLEVESCIFSKHLELGDVLLHFYSNWQKNTWLSWLPYKSGFINFNILETSKDRPNTPPSLNLLEQRVYKLVGGLLSPLDNVVESKDLRSGRVKRLIN